MTILTIEYVIVASWNREEIMCIMYLKIKIRMFDLQLSNIIDWRCITILVEFNILCRETLHQQFFNILNSQNIESDSM